MNQAIQTSRKARVAINGFGRIGREIARQICSSRNNGLELVAINTLSRIDLSVHLLRYDSIYGVLPLSVDTTDCQLVINGGPVFFFEQENPAMLPWADLDIDIVIECAGLGDKSRSHLKAGASSVIVAGSTQNPDITICMGVNHGRFESGNHRFICGASCTATMVAPVIALLDDAFGVEQAMVTFIHSYTSEQNLLDSHASDPRRTRSATQNIIPTSTSAIAHLTTMFPWLAGKIDGLALRVPTPLVHMADLVLKVKKKSNSKEVLLQILEKAAQSSMKNILAVNYEPLVSYDFRGRSHSCIVDAEFSEVSGNMIKLVVWHDNEHGYSSRIIALAQYIADIYKKM